MAINDPSDPAKADLPSARADVDPDVSPGADKVVLAQAETELAQAGPGVATDGVPGEPGDPGPTVELDPDALAALLVAIAQGQDLDEALGDMLQSSLQRAGELNASPESILEAVEAFRSTLLEIMSEGQSAEEAIVAADRAFTATLQVSQEQQSGEQDTDVISALATGQNVDEAVGEDSAAFEEALQEALDGGATLGDALAQAEEAQAVQDQLNAEAAEGTPGDALIAALSSGENLGETVGDGEGGDGATAFEDALVAALQGGENIGDALAEANEAADVSNQVTAEQQAEEANADPLLAALASGNNDSGALGPDTTGMTPEQAAAANEAFQNALNQALASGQSPSEAGKTAGGASRAIADATAEAQAGEEGSVLAQMASGDTENLGPDTTGMTPEQAAAAAAAFQDALANSIADGAAPDAAAGAAAQSGAAAASANAEATAGEQGSVLAQLASGNADNLGPDTSGMSPDQAAAAAEAFAQQLSNAVTDGASPADAAASAETVSNIAANDATPDAGTQGAGETVTQTADASPPPPPVETPAPPAPAGETPAPAAETPAPAAETPAPAAETPAPPAETPAPAAETPAPAAETPAPAAETPAPAAETPAPAAETPAPPPPPIAMPWDAPTAGSFVPPPPSPPPPPPPPVVSPPPPPPLPPAVSPPSPPPPPPPPADKAPQVATAPDAQTQNEDAPFTLDLANVFSDPDGDAVTISIGNLPTWLTLNGTSLSGTPTNAAVGTTTLNLTGTAKSKSVTSTLSITVNDTNDAPEVAFTPAALAFTENDGATALDAAITITEIDTAAANLAGVQTVVVQITGNYANGQDVLTFADQNGITGNWDAPTGTMTLTATGGVSSTVMQAALRTLTYNNTSELPSESARTISVTLTDTDSLSSATVTKTINVTQVDDAPIFATTATGDQFFARGNTPTPARIDNLLTLSDADTSNFNGGTLNVAISANNKATDRISIDNEGTGAGQIGFSGTTVTFAGATIGTITTGSDGVGTNALNIELNANATTAAVQALARAITFTNTNATVDLVSDPVVNIVLTDQSGLASNTFTRTVDIVSNNLPTNTAKTLDATEDTTLTFADNTFNNIFADTDGGDTLQAIRIDTLPPSSDGELFLSSVAVTAGQSINRADISELTFVPAANANVAKNGAVTFTFSVSDGKSFAATPATATITISAVDDKPTITMSGGRTYQTATARAILVDPGLVLIDPDAVNNSDAGIFADTGTGYLNVNITANRLAGDLLSIQNTGTGAGQIGFNGTTITYGGTTIGTIDGTLNGSSNQALQINLNNSASNDAVQALARAVTVRGADRDQGSSAEKTISFSASDGQNVGDAVTRVVDFDGLLIDNFNAPGTTRPTLSFDGDDDFITLPGSVAQSGEAAFTIESWINTSLNSGATQTIMSLGDLTQTQQIISTTFDNATGVTVSGTPSVTGGALVLTPATGGVGTAIIDPTGNAEGARNFSTSFDMLIGGGTTPAGDGMSFTYGQNSFVNGGQYEDGTTDGLSIAFDTYNNGNGDTFNTLDVIVDGNVIQSGTVAGGIRTAPTTQVLNLDGVNGYVDIPVDTLNNQSSGTIETWVKFDSVTSEAIFSKQHDGINSYAIFTVGRDPINASTDATPGKVYFRAKNSVSDPIESNATLNTGEWYHLAVTFDSNGAALYVNGALDNSVTGVDYSIPNDTADANARSARIGDWQSVSNMSLDGQMDDFRIWNDVRTAQEISDNYQTVLTGNQGGSLIANYTFEGGNANDAVGSNNGSLQNTATIVAGSNSNLAPSFVNVTVTHTDNGLTVTYDGDTIINNLDLGANYAPQTSDQFIFGARTGGANDRHEIDNLTITANDLGSRNALAVINGQLQFLSDTRNGATEALITSSSGTPVADGDWHHVAATHDGDNTLKLYVDGALVQTITGIPKDILSAEATIGSGPNGTDFYNGLISEIRLWNDERTATEIADSYLPDLSNPSGDASLVGYWRAADLSGQSINDSSANNNDATLGSSSGNTTGDPSTGTTSTHFQPVDSTKWTVVEGTHAGSANDLAYVDDGDLVIQNRELVRSADQFAPTSGTPVHTSGTFMFTGGTADFFHLMTRADPSSTSSSGFPTNGLNFSAVNADENIIIDKYVEGTLTTLTLSGDANVTLTNNTEYSFDVYDDGTNLRFTVTEVGNVSNTATVTATDSTSFGTNYVVLTNRIDTGTTENVVRLDNLNIDQDIVLAENATFTGTLPSTGLTGPFTFAALSNPEHGTLSIDANTGAYSYTPASGYHGQDTFSFQVTNANGAVNTQTLSFNVRADLDVNVGLKHLNFDGTNDYLTVPDNSSLDFDANASFTLEMWIKPDSFASAQSLLDKSVPIIQPTTTDDSNYRVSITTDGKIEIWSPESSNKTFDGTSLTVGEWAHIALSYDATSDKITMYQNGEFVGELAATEFGTVNTGPLLIGKDNQDRYFDGQMDELRIWNEARSADDIRLNYDQQLSGTETTLSAYYRFDDIHDGEVIDKSPNSNTASLGDPLTLGDEAEPTITDNSGGTPAIYGTIVDVAENTPTTGIMVSNDELSGNVSYSVNAAGTTSFTTTTNGTVTIDANTGAWTYTPATNYAGTDTFSLIASDSASGTETETITVNVAGDGDENSSSMSDGVLVLDGNGDFAQAPDPSLANSSFSIEFWSERASDTEFDIAIGQGNTSNNTGLHVGWRAGSTFTFAFFGDDLDYTNADSGVGELIHWAVTYDATTNARIIYKNGQAVANDTATADYQGTGNLQIGSGPIASSEFAGLIDEVRVWSDVRTPQEISVHYDKQMVGNENNLQAYYRFDDDPDGTTINNSATATGNALDGTLQGNASIINLPQKAASFDGNDDYLSVGRGTGDELAITGDVSLETWVKFNSLSAQGIFSFAKLNSSGGEDAATVNSLYELRIDNNGDITVGHETGNGTNVFETFDTNLVAGHWYHIGMVRDTAAKSYTVFVNGEPVGTQFYTSNNPTGGETSELHIGVEARAALNDHLDGQMSDTRVWNVARTDQEIHDNYNRTLTGNESGKLLLNLTMDEVVGGVILDQAGANNATPSGNVSIVTAAPTVQGNTGVTEEDQSISGQMTSNDVSGTAAYSVTGAGTVNADGVVEATTANGGKVLIDQSSGAWTYTPASNWYGTDTFVLTANGDDATDDSETISITVNNDVENSIVINDGVLHTTGASGTYASGSIGTNTITNQVTLEFKVNLSEVGSTQTMISLFDTNGTARYAPVVRTTGELYFFTTSGSVDSEIILSTDTWYDIAFTYDGTTLKGYLDGSLVASDDISGMSLSNAAQSILIGERYTGGTNTTNGLFDEVKVWSTARTPEQIRDGIDQPLAGNETGLEAYYKFDDETTSTTLQDKTANNRDLTLSGDAKVIDDIEGALRLDGTNDVITIANDASLDGAEGTWSIWMKTDGDWTDTGTGTNNEAILMTRGDAADSQNGLSISLKQNGTLSVSGRDADSINSVAIADVGSVADGGWHQVTLSYDTALNGLNKLYVDGQLVAASRSSEAWAFNGQNITVGSSSDTFWDKFKGEIGGVEIYNRKLTDDEIANGFGNETNPATSGLVGLYDFAEGTGTTAANDATVGTQAPDATITGATWLDYSNDTTANTLIIQEDETASGQMIANDMPGTPTYAVQTQAAKGVVTMNADGTWDYVPTANFYGTDTFTLRASSTDADGTAFTDSETVTVTINSVDDGNAVQISDGALSLDGTNDYVDIPDSVLSNTEGTVSLRFNLDATAPTNQVQYLFANRDDGTGGGDRVYITAVHDGANWRITANLDNETITGDVVTPGTWYEAAIVWKTDNTGELFLDGNSQGTATGVTLDAGGTGVGINTGVGIGTYNEASNSQHAKALIDEVSIWSAAQSASNIQSRTGQQLVGNETGLTAYYRFDDDTDGTTVKDYTSNDNDGTRINGADIVDPSTDPTVLGNAIEIQTSEVAAGTFTPADVVAASASYTAVGGASAGGTTTLTTTQGGTLSINESTGAWTYTPVAGYYGDDSFTLRASSTTGGTTLTDDEVITVTVKSDDNVNLNEGVLDLNGTSQYLSVADANNLDFGANQSFTLETWVRLNDVTTLQSLFDKGTLAGDDTNYRLSVQNGRIEFWSPESGVISPTEATITAGQWTHFAVSYDGTNDLMSFYKNGEQTGASVSVTEVGTTNTGPLLIGRDNQGRFLDGQMDDVRVWNDLRTADEIRENYDQQLSGSENGLAGYWQFDDATTGTVQDLTSNNNDATLTGGAQVVRTVGPSLSFDGTDDVVTVTGIDSELQNTSFTIEFWSHRDATDNAAQIPIGIAGSQGDDTSFLHFGYTNGTNMRFSFNATGSDNQLDYTDTGGSLDEWAHWAATYDATTNQAKLFKDGVVVGLQTFANDFDGTGDLTLGNSGNGSQFFDGNLNDVRIWNTVRTDDQIATNYNTTLTGNQGGALIANYTFEEASGNAINTANAGTYDGTISGATRVDDIPPIVGRAVTIEENEIVQGQMGADGADANATYAAGTPSNGGAVTMDATSGRWTYTPAENFHGTETFVLTATGAQGTVDAETITVTVNDVANVSPITSGGLLVLDGTNDYVTSAHSTSTALNGNFTIEAWINASSAGGGGSGLGGAILSKENQFVLSRHSDGSIQVAFNGQPANTFAWIDTGFNVSLNSWTHLSLTYDESARAVNLYANGSLVSSLTSTDSNLIPSTIAETTSAVTIGGRVLNNEYFNGSIDDVRVWNDVRTATEIRDNFDQTVATNADNLAANWIFDNVTGTVSDRTSNNNDGTLTNGANIASPARAALSFDGGDYVALGRGTGDELAITGNLTLEGWFKADQIGNDLPRLFNFSGDSTSNNNADNLLYGLFIYSDGRLGFIHENGGGLDELISTSSSAIEVGEWTHIAAVRDISEKTQKVFVNGELVASRNYTNEADGGTSGALGLGAASVGTPASFFQGDMSDIRIWNTARTDQQIADNYDNTIVGDESSALVAHYTFDEASGQAITDSAGNNNGTLGVDGTASTDDPTRTTSTPDIHSLNVSVMEGNTAQGTMTGDDVVPGTVTFGVSANANVTGATSRTIANKGTVEIDSSSGDWTFTPLDNFNGTATFYLTASGGGVTDAEQITITAQSVPEDSVDVGGSAIVLDGVDDALNAAVAKMNTGTGAFTYETWFNTSMTARGDIINIGTEAGGMTKLHIESGKLNFDKPGTNLLQSNATYNDGNWHHTSVTYDGTVLRMYVDGELIGENASASITVASGAVRIGASHSDASPTTFFDGMLDETRLWSTQRSHEDIRDNYDQQLAGNETGLQAYYTYDNRDGLTVNDTSLTTSNGAIEFDGSTQYMTIANDGVLDGRSQGTIETWIYLDDNTNSGTITVSQKDGINTVSMFRLNSEGKLLFHAKNATSDAVANTVLSTGQWHHVAVAFDTSDVRFYINGQLDATVTGDYSIPDLTSPLNSVGEFRQENGSGTNSLDGRLDDLRIWNDKRTAAEIANNYQQTLTGNQGNNLVAHYTFEEGSGSTATDSAGSNNGTLTGAPARSTDTPNLVAENDGTLVGNPSFSNAGPDVFGNTMTIVEDQTASGTMNASDLTGTAAYSIDTAAANGTVSINGSSGAWTYTPNGNYSGADTFALRAADGTFTDTETITVTIKADNDPSISGPVLQLSGGASDYATASGIDVSNQSFSIEFWANRATDTDTDFIISQGTATNNNGLHMGYRGTGGAYDNKQFSLAFWGNDLDYTDTTTNTQTWVHWAATYDADSKLATLYKNGVSVATKTMAADYAGSGTLNIGKSISGDNFNGMLDDIRIWNDVRSANEVAANYDQQLSGSETNLLAYYTMESPDGVTITDKAGSNNNATAQVSDGVNIINLPPAALDLDGTGDYVDVPLSVVNNLSAGTIESWVYFDSVANETIFTKQHDGTNTYAVFSVGHTSNAGGGFQDETDGKVFFRGLNAGGSLESSTTLQTGQWYHLAVTFTGTEAKLYINGELDKFESGNFAIPDDTSTAGGHEARIGSWKGNASDMDGKVADFRVWNDVRTSEEISSNYNHLPTGNEAGLLLNYHFDEINGSTIVDESTNANDGTAQGDPIVVDPRPALETNAVTITNADTISGTMPSDDVTGTASFTISDQPDHGTVEVDATSGLWTYTPTTNYVGNDSFTVRATGATSGTDDEVISVVVNDSSAISNTPTQSALQFDGVNDYVDIGGLSENISGAYTMESWVYYDPAAFTDNGWMRVMELGNGPDSDNLLLAIDPAADLFSFDTRSGATASSVDSLTTPPTAQWMHVAGVNDGAGNAHLYINGELVNSASGQQIAQDIVRTNNYIGQSNWADESNMHGAVADVRIWNDARTSTEIRDNYNQTLAGNEDSLILNYTFDNVDDGVVRDITGNNNNGQVITDATDTTATGAGPTGDVLELDGTGDYMEIAHNASLSSANWTVETWFNTTTAHGGGPAYGQFVSKANDSGQLQYGLGMASGKVSIFTNDSTNAISLETDQQLNDGQWHHAAAVYDGSNLNLYIDGVLAKSTAFSATVATDTNPLVVGGRHAPGHTGQTTPWQFFDGQLDNVRVWNQGRSADDIRDGMTQSYDYDTANLVTQYTFDDIEGSGTVLDGAHSQAGGGVRINDLNGTLVGDAKTVDSGSGGGVAVGFLDGAIRFDGTNDGASDPADTIGALAAAERTIMLWAKSTSEEPQTFVSYGAGGKGEAFQFGLNTWDDPGSSLEGGKGVTIDVGSGAITFQPITATDDGQWHHYTVVLPTNGDSLRDLKVYQDGVLLNTISALFNNEDVTIDTQASALQLGHHGTTDYFNGDMAEISVWSTGLTTAQINQHMNGQLNGSETGLTAYWRGDADGSGNLKDYAGSNDLTLANDASVVDVAPDIQSSSVRISEGTIATGQVASSTTNSSATYAVQTAATSGTVTVDSATGVWNYVPNASFSGTDTFTLQSTGNVTTESQTISVRVGENPSLPASHALVVDGTDDYVDFGDSVGNGGSDGLQSFTVEMWVDFSALHAADDVLASKGNLGSTDAGWSIRTATNSLEVRVSDAGGDRAIQNIDTTGVDDGWHHVAMVVDRGAGTIKGYLDGIDTNWADHGTIGGSLAAVDSIATSLNMLAGASDNSGTPTQFFGGRISEVRLWDDARTATEIANNYDRQLSGDEADLSGYWTFNEGDGAIAIDQSGNGNDAAIIGGTHENMTSISMAAGATYKGLILGADADNNDTLSYSLSNTNDPNAGSTLTLDSDGSFTYTNDGTDDDFAVIITDSDGNQTIETINVDV